jgi:hypothetical protein
MIVYSFKKGIEIYVKTSYYLLAELSFVFNKNDYKKINWRNSNLITLISSLHKKMVEFFYMNNHFIRID